MKNLVGTVLLSRFRVDTLLSAGAAGSLYRGLDLKRSLPLSIKVFETPVPYDPNALCFQQDEGTLQTLMHPNIAPFYGLFEDQGVSFLVEKYIEGQVLAQIIQGRNGQPFPTQEALIFLKTLATTLEYAHGFGLVHCTVNPFNILVGQDGTIYLTNFGFSRHADRSMSSSGILGLPAYNAPEQFRSANVSPATDVYALGMLFFELITGVHPFLRIPTCNAVADRVTIDRLRDAHLNQPPPDPCQLNSNLPDGIGETISIALAKDPKQRYQSVQEMLEIICAIFGVPVQKVPDRLRPSAGGDPLATQVMQKGAPRVDAPGGVPGVGTGTLYVPPAPGSGTQYVPPVPGGAPAYPPSAPGGGTQYVPPAPGAAPGYYQSAGGAYPSAGQGPMGTQVVPGTPGFPGQPRQGTMPVSAAPPPAAPPLDLAGAYPAEKPKRPAWIWIAIGAAAVFVVLCGIGLGAGLPIIKDLFGTQTPTPTATFTATAIPPTETAVPATALPSPTPTEAIQVPPTLPPPPPPPPPTEFTIPTVVPLPTQPPFLPSATVRYGFKVTVHNNKNYPIYPFRDNRSMGGPIPPYKYIYYLSIPPGPHNFTFCLDPNMSNCPFTRQLNVDKDLDINIP
jgi:Protein kinase domain